MPEYLPARILHRLPDVPAARDRVILSYDDRFLRRKRLVTAQGAAVLVDLPAMVSLNHGDVLETADGTCIEVIAATEDVTVVRGAVARLAWHVGNRHTPCQIEADRLIIRRDAVLEAMLRGLGATLEHVTGPFVPEGGAYGHGRTLGHSHTHEHDHHHDHGHSHGHDRDHAHDHGHGMQGHHRHDHDHGPAQDAARGGHHAGDPAHDRA